MFVLGPLITLIKIVHCEMMIRKKRVFWDATGKCGFVQLAWDTVICYEDEYPAERGHNTREK